MPEEKDKIKKLYDTFVSDGYDMESEEDFRKNLLDSTKRKAAYDALVKDGYDMEPFEEFESNIGFGKERTSSQQSGNSASGTVEEPISPANEQTWQPTEKEKVAMLTETDRIMNDVKSHTQTFNERIDNMQEYGINPGLQTKEGKMIFNPESGKLEKTFLTPAGNRYYSKSLADMESFQYRQAADMSIGGQLRKANLRLQELKAKQAERASEVHKEWAEETENNKAPLAAILGAATYTPRQQSDKENRALSVAIRETEELIKNLEEQKDRENGVDVGFWRGFGRTMGDVRTWDFGMGDMRDAFTMMNADELKKENATEGEREAHDAMMGAIHEKQQAEERYSGNADFWNRAGVMTGYMPSFMLDFVLTGGGFNGLSSFSKGSTKLATKVISKETAEKMAQQGFKSYIKENGAKGLGRYASDWTIKALGTTADDLLVRAPLMANTVQAGKTTADIIDRKLGDVVVDENGNYDFSNDKTWGDAIWQSEANAIIENYSEMFGAHLDPVFTLGNMSKLANVLGAKRIGAVLSKADASALNGIMGQTHQMFNKMGVSDYVGEVSEEYYGQLWRTMLNLDDAYQQNPDGTRTNLFASGQFHGDIWGGMALSMGLMGAGKHTLSAANYTSMKHGVNKADAKVNELLGKEVWEPLKATLDLTTNENIGEVAELIAGDKDFTINEKAAVLDYMERSLNLRGFNLASMAQSRGGNRNESVQQANDSYLDGYNIISSQEMNDAKNMYEYQRARVADLVDESMFAMIEENPIAALEFVNGNEQWNDEDKVSVIDYINAKQVYNGMIQRVRDDIDGRIEQSNSMIDARVNHNTGMIQGATMKQDERKVYVISGKLVPYDDGSGVSVTDSDNSIIIRDSETGALEQVSPDTVLSLDESQDPNEQKELAEQAIVEQFAREAADKIDGKVTFNPGDAYTITGQDGSQMQVQIIANEDGIVDNGDGTVNVSDGVNIFPLTKETIQQQADAANLARVAQFEQQRTIENAERKQEMQEAERPQYALNDIVSLTDENGVTVRGNITADADADGKYEVFTEAPINGKRVNLFTRDELDNMLLEHNGVAFERPAENESNNGAENIPENDNNAPQNIPAMQRIPKDEQGNPLYEQADSDTAWDAIVEQTEGDEDMAQTVADGMVADKEEALKKLEKAKSKGGNSIAEKIASEKERKAAIDAAKQDLLAWQKIAGTAKRRKMEADDERRRIADEAAALRKAEEEKLRAEREEAERIEREALNGVPDMMDDKPQDARARGYRRMNGHKIDRQEPVQALQGKEVSVKFSDDAIVGGRVAVIDANLLQPSHIQGVRNPLHFIDEAQPKERNDEASVLSARKIAGNIRPEEITSSVTAYTGAPTVNARGEAIQGNNRSDALRIMWENHPEQAALYKQYLKDHAEEFGLQAEDIEAMEHPVLVNMVDVDDAEAIRLGQYVAQDTESGGVERIKPKNAIQRMGAEMRSFANLLLRTSDDEMSFAGLVDSNGANVLKWMSQRGFITPTQYKSAFDSKDNLTPESKNDLRGIMYQSIFKDGSTRLEEMFNVLPVKAQKAILATAFRDYDSPNSERMVDEIQNSVRAYYALSQDKMFAEAKNFKEARTAIESWKRQYQMDDVTGESYLPADNFSNFVLHLAAMYKGESQSFIQNTFGKIYDLIQGTQEETLFEQPDNTPRTLVQAIKEAFNLDYNGQQRSNVLVGDTATSQRGQQGSNGTLAPRERVENGNGTTDDTGRTESIGGQSEIESSLSQEEMLSSDDTDNQLSAKIARRIEVQEDDWIESGKYGDTYKQTIIVDGTHKVIKVDAPDTKGNYIGSAYEYDGQTFGDLLDVLNYIDTSLSLANAVAVAEKETDTTPTEKQKEAGNYKKGHVQVGTFNITIENPKGSVRSGIDTEGNKWETIMQNTYGYIRGTEGVDGDHIDVFLSDDIDGWNGRRVFVVDQYNEDGSFDEHKVMLGFNETDDAEAAYFANYDSDWANNHKTVVTAVNLEDFEKWIDSSHRKTKAFAEYKSVKSVEEQSSGTQVDRLSEIKSRIEELHKEQEAAHVQSDIFEEARIISEINDLFAEQRKLEQSNSNEETTTPTDAAYTITPAQYTTKRGKVLDMHLVKFNNKLRDTVRKHTTMFAKQLKGWWDKEKQGFMMRSKEDAERLAEYATDAQSQPPLSLSDLSEVNDGNVQFAESQLLETSKQEEKQEYSPVWQYSVSVDKETGLTTLKRDDVSGPIPIGDGRFNYTANSPEEMLEIVRNPKNFNQELRDAVETILENKVKIREIIRTEKAEATEQESKPENNPSGNRLVTDERYAELRERMRKKLLGQMNIGIDPEILAIGTEMAVYHLEKGARKFTEYATAMVADLGDSIRPYLKAFYNGARDLPEVAENGLDADMTPYDEVQQFDVANFDKKSIDALATAETVTRETEVEQEAEIAQERIKKSRPARKKNEKKAVNSRNQTGGLFGDLLTENDKADAELHRQFAMTVKADMLAALDNGTKPYRSILDLRKRASELGMEVDNDGRTDILLQELVEDGLVRAAREVIERKGSASRESYDLICKLYEMQPTISARSSNRIKMQQYSTPLPMAWIAGRFAMADKADGSVLEPTAGNGMLVFTIPVGQVHVNELDKTRLDNLREQGFAQVTQQDATEPFDGDVRYDVVIANPPFGKREAVEYDGKKIPGLDPQITLNALSSMKDDGRAAIIIGGNMEYANNGAIKSMKPFFTYLYDHYNVKGVIDMGGGLYAKQGTTFPTRMILIDGRRTNEERAQIAVYPPVENKAIRKAESFDDLYEIINEVLNFNEKTNGTEVLRSQGGRHLSVADNASGETDGAGHNRQSEADDESGSQTERRGRTGLEGNSESGQRPVLGKRGQNDTVGETGRGTDTIGKPSTDGRGLEQRTVGNEPQPVDGVDVQRIGLGLKGKPKKRDLTEEKLPYRPHNTAFRLESVAPAAMVEAMDKVLSQIEAQHGSIDEFVKTELGYDTIAETYQALAAEQMDSVAMAIYQMKQEQALIIGDQTGVGKGRQMAALIRWAVQRGEKPVFITQKADLFSDIYRDLVDVGSGDLVPFIFNSDGAMVDSKGNTVHKPLSSAEMAKVFASGALPEEYDFAVLTYSQVNTGDAVSQQEMEEAAKKSGARTKKSKNVKNGKATPKATFLRAIAKDNYLFLDESHTAAGSSNTGAYLQSILRGAKAATFASATFAKRPDTMPLYAIRTAMSQAKVDPDKMISIIEKGGVTLQEIMSRELTNAGQMVRRERDMSDVVTDWKTITDPETVRRARENYDRTIAAFNAIIKFQEDYVKPMIEALDMELAVMAESAGVKRGTDKMGVENVPFASKTYNYTKQLMLALKVNAIADEVEAEINAGRHPVIALESTMESSIKDYAAGEIIDEPTFSASLLKGLDTVMQYTVKDEDGNERHERYSPQALGPVGEKAYYELQDFIRESTSDIFISPLDAIIERLNKKGYKVGELTGRNMYVERNDDGRVVVKRRTDKDKKKMQREFNSGVLDVLILNKSASTGISLHASEKFSDQRQRSMIIAQPLSDINDYMQMIGRIDRTGQVHRGYYINLGLPVPAENRFLMMLSTKLKSLNANTTTSQDSESNDVEAPDLLNKYGSQVVVEYLRDNVDIYEKMGTPLKKGGLGGGRVQASELEDYKPQEDDARKITGYVALLATKEQEEFYDDVVRRYNELIKYLNDTGSNDLKITVMPLRATTIEKRISSEGIDPDGNNPFARNSFVEKVEMDVLRKPMKADEIRKVIEQINKGVEPNTYLDNVIETIRKEDEVRIAAEDERYEKSKAKAIDDIAKQTEKINGQKKRSDEEKRVAIDNFIAETNEKVEAKHKDNILRLNTNSDQMMRRLRMFEVGKSYLVPDNLESMIFDFATSAIFCGYKTKDSKITASTTLAIFATLDGRRRIEIKLSQIDALRSIDKVTNDNWDAARATTLDNWDSQIPSETRKTGFIMTGNILQAIADTQDEYGGYPGQLISYTDIDGNVHDGILMPDKWNASMLKTSGAPLSSRLQQIKDYTPITSHDGKVEIMGNSWAKMFYLTVPKTKKDGAVYYENKTLLRAAGGNFYPYRGKLRADIPEERIIEVVKELAKLGVKVKDDTTDILQRNGIGAYNDDEVSYENDPVAKLLGQSRRTAKQRREFARRERQRMAERVESLAEKLHLDNVEVVTDASVLDGKKQRAKGFYSKSTGKITIVIPNHTSTFDVEQTLLHEAVAHYGLRQLFGKHFDTFLDNVFNNADENIRRRIVDMAAKNGWDFHKATEEYLASLAEDTEFENINASWWQQIKDFFLNMLHKIGFEDFRGVTLSDNELRYILWRSYENLAEPGRYRNILGEAADVAKQYELKVGNYAVSDPHHQTVAESDDALYRTGDPEIHERELARDRYERRVKSGMFQSQEALQDSMLGLKEAMTAILGKETNIEDVDGFENAYLGENRLSSVNKAEADAFAHTLFKPMLDEVAKLARTEAEREELTDYMMAKHGLERNTYMRNEAINNGATDADQTDYAGLTSLTGIDNVTDAETEAQIMVNDYEQAHDTTDLWKKVNAASKAILSKSYECGMMSKATFDKISDMYDFYIPLRGFDEKTSSEAYAYLTHKQSAFNAPIKKAEGRRSKADDPFANLQSMAEGAIMQGNRNKLVKQRFLNFALNHSSDLVSVSDIWVEYDTVADEWKPVFPDNIDSTDTPEVVERKMLDFETKMESLAQQYPDRYKHGKDTVNIPYRIVESRDMRQHQIVVKRGGRDYVITINGNPRAAQALNGQTNPDNDMSGAIGAILRAGENINRQLSAFYTTRNPDFIVSNFMRDMLYTNTMTWIRESPNYALRFHRNYMYANPVRIKQLLAKHRKGTLDMSNKTEAMFHQFMMNGGETGYANIRDIEQHKNDIRRELKKSNGKIPVKKAWDLLGERFDEYNRAVENCARFAAFMTSREMGRSIDRAIYDAKEISVNFNKKGSGAKFYDSTGQTKAGNASALVSGLGRSGYVFWNAAIQGTANFGRQMKRHPAKAFTGIAAMFLLGAIVAYLGGDDDDDDDKNAYYNLPEYVRRSNILFRAGNSWVSIPLPVEYRAVYGMGELMISVLNGKEHLTGEEIAEAITGQATQILPIDFLEGGGGLNAFVPSAYKPLWEAYVAEKSWTGMPLYKDTPYNKDMPEWTKAYKSANKYIVGLANAMNEATGGDPYTKGTIDFNPAKIEYMLNGYFGGVFGTIDKLSKTAETITDNRDYDPRSFLLVNRLVKVGDERTEYRAVNNEYFRLKEEHDRLKSRLKRYEEDTDNDIFDYAEKIDFLYNSPEYERYEIFEDYRRDIDDLYNELNDTVDDEERKNIEAELNELKKEMIEEMNKTRK
nr:MAG: ddrB-like ParB superfamily domain protein [Bacteriophage sp.]